MLVARQPKIVQYNSKYNSVKNPEIWLAESDVCTEHILFDPIAQSYGFIYENLVPLNCDTEDNLPRNIFLPYSVHVLISHIDREIFDFLNAAKS